MTNLDDRVPTVLTRRGRVLLALGIVAFFLGGLALGGYLYLRSIGVYGEGVPGDLVSVEIPKGSTVGDIGRILESSGVVPSAFGFRVVAYLEGGAEDIQAGKYELPQGLSARAALEALLQEVPAPDFVTVTFPEGSWLTDFARILERDSHISGDRFLSLTATAQLRSDLLPDGIDTLEGLLFPSTYQVIDKDTPRTIAQRLLGQMEEEVAALDQSAIEDLGISPYEAIIVASMIEAEAKIPEERPMVAAVVYNRLEQGIALGIDATVLYALGEHKETLTASDLEIDSPYNTREVVGLPPTPIGAPGRASLQAAFEPADGEWLYYVLEDCEGHHHFSESYDEFLQYKRAYQALDC
ncbi:MAG TPA: endolytic transglycosylase MltG [Actinomycetota bacterium]|nr:endolytic transglycosylase MltG [Actinomycetota bacterium]